MDVATLIDRLSERADIWEELAGLNGDDFATGVRFCVDELRTELRALDTLPAPGPSATTTPAPPANGDA